MKIKYIAIRNDDGDELLFTFPVQVVHKSMFQAVTQIRDDEVRWSKPYFNAACVGAGFIEDNTCYGMSESLGVSSRPEADTALLRSGSET